MGSWATVCCARGACGGHSCSLGLEPTSSDIYEQHIGIQMANTAGRSMLWEGAYMCWPGHKACHQQEQQRCLQQPSQHISYQH